MKTEKQNFNEKIYIYIYIYLVLMIYEHQYFDWEIILLY